MARQRKENEQSLAEKLLRAYEKSNSTADFGEIKNQISAMEWVRRMMEQLQQNELRANSDDK